jgi:hypothetical protein
MVVRCKWGGGKNVFVNTKGKVRGIHVPVQDAIWACKGRGLFSMRSRLLVEMMFNRLNEVREVDCLQRKKFSF